MVKRWKGGNPPIDLSPHRTKIFSAFFLLFSCSFSSLYATHDGDFDPLYRKTSLPFTQPSLNSDLLSEEGSHQPSEIPCILFKKTDATGLSFMIVRNSSGAVSGMVQTGQGSSYEAPVKGLRPALALEHLKNARAILKQSHVSLEGEQLVVRLPFKGGMKTDNEEESSTTIPPQFYCPVTHEMMEDPWSNELGHTYEKSVLERLKAEGKPDPLTNTPFQHLFPNLGMKQLIQGWKEQNATVVKPGFPYMKERKDAHAQSYLKLARELEERQAFEEAEKTYKEALKYTDHPEVYGQYAQLFAKRGNTEKAYRAFYELGQLYQGKADLKAAQASYEEALRLCAPLHKEQTLKALVAIHKGLQTPQEMGLRLNELGLFYASTGRLKEGIQVLEEAYEAYPTTQLLETLGGLYTQTGNQPKMIETQDRLFRLTLHNDPENIGVYRNYSRFLKSIGKPQEAAVQKQKCDDFFQRLSVEVKDLRLRVGMLELLEQKLDLLQRQQGQFYAESIDLSDLTDLENTGFQAIIEKSPNLRFLNLRGCSRLTDRSIDLLVKRCPNIRELDLSGCVGIKDSSVNNAVEKLEFLEKLIIENHSGLKAETLGEFYKKGLTFSVQGNPQVYNKCIATLKLAEISKRGYNAEPALAFHTKQLQDGRVVFVISETANWGSRGSSDRGLKVWDVNQQVFVGSTLIQEDSIQSLIALDDGRLLSVGSNTCVWDIDQKACLVKLRTGDGYSRALGLRDNKVISANCNKIQVWDLDKQVCTRTWEDGDGSHHITPLTELRDGRVVTDTYVGNSNKRVLKTWDLNKQACVAKLSVGEGHVQSLIELQDGRLVAGLIHHKGEYGRRDSRHFLKIWEAHQQGGATTITIGAAGESDNLSLTELQDGRVASGGGNTIKIWDINQQVCTATLYGHTKDIQSVIQLQDGRLVSSANDNTLKVWFIA